jgi:glycerate 2-kinase
MSMHKVFIKNFRALAKTAARRDALEIIEAGLAAVATDKAIRRSLRLRGDKLMVGGRTYDLSSYDHIYVIGFGKDAYAAAVELEKILGSRITAGIALDVQGGPLKRIRSLVGTHPLPSPKNVLAAGEVMALLEKVDSADLVITVVSGGGSALLCRPYGLKCSELALVTKTLMRAGATIIETNTVRKHLSEILGGQFARLAYPATVLGLIFSDVPGDELDMIASGPTVRDTTTVADAAAVLAKYDIIRSCSLPGCDLRETPKDRTFFRRVHNVLIVNNRLAAEAMRNKAKRIGYDARILSTSLQGEAREVGRRLAAMPDSGEAVIAAGETTVTVKGNGRGGRSQELALGALGDIREGGVVISCASDGRDNGPAAGALADALVARTAARLKLDPRRALSKNDSFPFFEKAGGLIITGQTGINVSDLMLSLRE